MCPGGMSIYGLTSVIYSYKTPTQKSLSNTTPSSKSNLFFT